MWKLDGWGEALDCHEQSDPLGLLIETALVVFKRASKGREWSLAA